MLEIYNLTKVYSGNRGLYPISFRADKGEAIAIVGHNGAGKSTLLKMLGGWILPDSGRALIEGTNISDRSALARKTGFIPETPNLYDNFSVEYNLKLFARLFRVSLERVVLVMEQFGLLKFRNDQVRVLSKGLKQRVSIARALLSEPPVILFDEPTAGLDYNMTGEIHALFKTLHESGKTILFTSHRAEETKTLATRVINLQEGKMVFDGLPYDKKCNYPGLK